MDAVSKVLNLASSDIEDTPDSGAKPAMPFILGIAKLYGKVKSLLDIDRVMKHPKDQRFRRPVVAIPTGGEALRRLRCPH